MFWRLVGNSIVRQRRRKLLAGAAVMLGTSLATAMLLLGAEVGDRVAKELRAYGANIVVTPADDSLEIAVGGLTLKPSGGGSYLKEADLPKIRQIFWAHNIVGFSPLLNASVKLASGEKVELLGTYFARSFGDGAEAFTTGVTKTHPWWRVAPGGRWPAEDGSQDSEAVVGERLAAKLGLKNGDAVLANAQSFRITGILSTGGPEDDFLVVPLNAVQRVLGRPGAVRSVLVSALTKPEDDFGRRDPHSMSGPVLERWMCSPYANTIAHQIALVLPGAQAEQIRAVAQNEGAILERIAALMWLLTAGALVTAALAVAASMATTVIERRHEIALLRSLGAGSIAIMRLFFMESILIALAGGSLGFVAGGVLAQRFGMIVLGGSTEWQPELFPIILILAAFVALAGSVPAMWKAIQLEPSAVLRGDLA